MKTEEQIVDILQGAFNYAENKVDEVLYEEIDYSGDLDKTLENRQKRLARAQGMRAMVRMIAKQMELDGDVFLGIPTDYISMERRMG